MNENQSSFKLPEVTQKLLCRTIEKCGDQIDLAGWRYCEHIGASTYEPIDANCQYVQREFSVCLKFLKHFFPKCYHTETVSSEDLKCGAEIWWEESNQSPISINNGIMLLAIIARGLAPPDLWFNMEPSQQAFISVIKWDKFCEDYNYKTKKPWWKLNDESESEDCESIKIN